MDRRWTHKALIENGERDVIFLTLRQNQNVQTLPLTTSGSFKYIKQEDACIIEPKIQENHRKNAGEPLVSQIENHGFSSLQQTRDRERNCTATTFCWAQVPTQSSCQWSRRWEHFLSEKVQPKKNQTPQIWAQNSPQKSPSPCWIRVFLMVFLYFGGPYSPNRISK